MRSAAFMPALLLLSSTLAGAQEGHATGHAHAKEPALGTIVFPNSGRPAAQVPFLKGIALLHSFEYEQAGEAFRASRIADPAFALAYYGEALTYSHVLWRFENLEASRAALARLAPTAQERIARGRTPLETLFATAVEKFFEEGTLEQRVSAYAAAMENLAGLRADEPEASAFAAHALMLRGYLLNGGARDSVFRKAIALAQRVATANPNHPGATHYLIHLYDSPGMAKEGLAFARAYDKIAPDAEHALHMPSHIYLQLGMWDDVVRSNERAWAASRADASNAAHADWHAFSWLHYGYLQQGRIRAASALVDSAERLLGNLDGPYVDARFAVTRLQFQQNAEGHLARRPVTAPASRPGPVSDRERGFREQARYWLAVDAVQHGDTAAIARLAAPYLAEADSVLSGANISAWRATNALVIRGMVVGARGDGPATIAAWRAAADAESRLTPFVGPPERLFAGELWMASVLAPALHTGGITPARRALIAEALPALENVLRLAPGRSRALHLLATVGDVVGPDSLRTEAFRRLSANYRTADADMRSLLPPNFR